MPKWLDIASGVTGVLGNIGSAFGGIFQASANRRFQAKQAELQRQFNAVEAQKARDYNTQMIDRQNFYNSPAEQVKRLIAAGLHPALAYGGNGAVQNIGVGSTSAQASSGASPSGAMADLSGLSNLSSSFENLAAASNLRTQSTLNEIEAKYRDVILNKEVLKLSGEIIVLGDEHNVKVATATNIGKQSALLDEKINNAKQEYCKLMAETQLTGQLIRSATVKAEIDEATKDKALVARLSEYGLTVKQFAMYTSVVKADLMLKSAQAFAAQKAGELSDKEKSAVDANVGYLKQLRAESIVRAEQYPAIKRYIRLKGDNLEIGNDFLPYEKSLHLFDDAVQTIGHIFDNIGKATDNAESALGMLLGL